MGKVFHTLVSVDDVLSVLGRYYRVEPLGVEVVGLRESLWRVLAEDVVAPVDVPPFDRSEVDGYAIISSDVVGAEEDSPVRLRVVGCSRIGEPSLVEVGFGEAVEVDTGAVIPRGADAVVMVEYCRRVGDEVYVYRSVSPGENIAFTGGDVMRGDLILGRGTLITPRELPLIAAVGLDRVAVFKRPRVGLVSIGSELRYPGESLRLGEIFDVNTYSISALLKELRLDTTIYGIVSDDYDSVYSIISKMLNENDIVITSGGTSAGFTDVTYRVINDLGSPGVVIHGLKVRPGKPTIFGVVNGKLVIGLPGFPLSAVMIFNVVVKPLLLRIMGLDAKVERKIPSIIAEKVLGGKGREHLIPVVLVSRGNELTSYPVPTASGSISVFEVADGFIRVPENVGFINEGERVDTYLLSNDVMPADLVMIGSHDYGINVALSLLKPRPNAKVVNVGSLAGLIIVGKGGSDIAGTHLLDEETNTYNLPFLDRLGLRSKVVLIRGYARKVGLIIQRGNPKNIKGVEDLLRSDVVLINRNRGSGTRTLLDMFLKNLAKEYGTDFREVVRKIKGYTVEAKTHTAVAAAVAQGRADVGLGIEVAAEMYGLNFIPLRDEHYDFAINTLSLDKPVVKGFIDVLKSDEFKDRLRRLRGYEVPNDVGTPLK
ncbi:MAG: molybdopterin biosynthesis protein [Sulfolobales archaeon]